MKFESPGALGGAPRVHLDWAWIWGHQGRPSAALGPLTETQNGQKTLEKVEREVKNIQKKVESQPATLVQNV